MDRMIRLEFRIKTLARIHATLMYSISTHCLCCHLIKASLIPLLSDA